MRILVERGGCVTRSVCPLQEDVQPSSPSSAAPGRRGVRMGMCGTEDVPSFPHPPSQAQSSSSSSEIQSQSIKGLCIAPGPPQHAFLGWLFLFLFLFFFLFFFSSSLLNTKGPFGCHCSAVTAPERLTTQEKKTNPPNPCNGFCASKQLLSDTKPSDKQLSPQLLPARLQAGRQEGEAHSCDESVQPFPTPHILGTNLSSALPAN